MKCFLPRRGVLDSGRRRERPLGEEVSVFGVRVPGRGGRVGEVGWSTGARVLQSDWASRASGQ